MAHENIHLRDIRPCYRESIADKLDCHRIAAHNWQTIANELGYIGGQIAMIEVDAGRKRTSPSLLVLEDWATKEGSKVYILRRILERNNRIDCVAILDEASADFNVMQLYVAIREKDGDYKMHEIKTSRDATLREALTNTCEIDNYEMESPQTLCGWETKAIVFKSQEIILKRKSLNELSPAKELQDCTVTTSSPSYNIDLNMEFGGEPFVEYNTGAHEQMETDFDYDINNEMADEHDYIFPEITNEEHVYNVVIRQPGHRLFGQSVSVPYGMPYFDDDDTKFMATNLQPCSNQINMKTDDSANGGDEPVSKECSPPCGKTISFPQPIPSISGHSQRSSEERRSLPQISYHPREERVSSATACDELLKSASRVSGWMPHVNDITTIKNILMKVKNADGHYALWLKEDQQKVVLSVLHLGLIYNYRIHHGCPDKYYIFRDVHVASSVGRLLEYHKVHRLQKKGDMVKHISLKTPVVRDTRIHPTRLENEERI